MALFKVFLLAVALSGCAHTYSNSSLQDIPDFESLVGSGVLETIEPGYDTDYDQASLTINERYHVVGRHDCKALIINTNKETILSVAQCGGRDEFYICANEPDECNIYFKTKKNGSSLILVKDWGWGHDETRRVVEFHNDKVVYRIQDENCLIGYPHGCIIDGFSWVDSYTYNYTLGK